MNYCTKCGNKLKKDSKFCNKCGNPTQLELEKRKKENDEKNKKSLFELGISLIIIANILLASIVLSDFSNIIKVIFILFEIILFISISVISKNLGLVKSHKCFWFISMVLLPILLLLINEYELTIKFFLDGAGLYVYLSLLIIICIIAYFLSYKYLNSNIYLYIICFLINMLALSIMLIFNLDKYFNNNADIVFMVLILLNLLLSVAAIINKGKKFSDIFIKYMKFALIIYLPFVLAYMSYSKFASISMIVTLIIIFISYIINSYIVILYYKKSDFSFVIPFIQVITIVNFIQTLFKNYNNMSIYILSLSLILLIVINYLFNNKKLKNSTLIFTIITFMVLFSNSIIYEYKVTTIVSLLLIITSIFIVKIEKSKNIKDIINIIIPVLIYIFLNSIILSNIIIKSVYIIILTSLLYSIISSYLMIRKNKISTIYEWFSYLFLLFAMITSILNFDKLASILVEVLWIYYYIVKSFFDKNKTFQNYLFTLSLINLVLVCANFNIKFYYTIITLSLILLISSMFNNKRALYLFSVALLIVASLFDFNKYNIFFLLLNLLLYIIIYTISFKKKNTNFCIKFLYVMLGFNIITKIIFSLINPIFVAALLSFIAILIILITMFLSEIDSDKRIMSYIIYLYYPLSILINEISVLYSDLILITLITIYIFIILEKVLTIRKKDKILFEILWMTYVTLCFILNPNIVILIYFLIVSLIFILTGMSINRKQFVYFGTIVLIINIIIQLFKVNNDLVIALSLLLIGVSLMQYVFIKELKNKKSNNK